MRHCDERPACARYTSYAGFESADLASTAESGLARAGACSAKVEATKQSGGHVTQAGSPKRGRLAYPVIGQATSGRTSLLAMTLYRQAIAFTASAAPVTLKSSSVAPVLERLISTRRRLAATTSATGSSLLNFGNSIA